MGDERISNFYLLAYYPDLVDIIDVLKTCNMFVEKTAHASSRVKLFEKFVVSDLELFLTESPCMFSMILPYDDPVETPSSLEMMESAVLDCFRDIVTVSVLFFIVNNFV